MLNKALFICSWSHSMCNSFFWFVSKLNFTWEFNLPRSLILLFIILIKSFFLNKGFGILAKSENSLTRFSIWLIWFKIIFKLVSNFFLFSPSKLCVYFDLKLSIVSWIGVKGFLISWANFLATVLQASWRSEFNSFSCWFLSLSIISLKFLFNTSISLSDFNSGTFISKFPIPISFEAVIKLLIEIKNLEENRIAIVIDRNNNKATIMI